jgi:hypothetical protein
MKKKDATVEASSEGENWQNTPYMSLPETHHHMWRQDTHRYSWRDSESTLINKRGANT